MQLLIAYDYNRIFNWIIIVIMTETNKVIYLDSKPTSL